MKICPSCNKKCADSIKYCPICNRYLGNVATISEKEYYSNIDDSNKTESKQFIPKCPTCGSPNVKKISTSKKIFGGVMFGLFSSDVRNSMSCNNCGYKW